MQKHIFFILIISGLAFPALSQKTAAQELMKVRDVYLSAETFSAEVVVKGYIDENDRIGTTIGTGMLAKTKQAYHSKFAAVEMVANSNCTVIIDHEKKTIIYLEASNKFQMQKSVIPDIDSLLALDDSVIYRGVKSGLKSFSFFSPRSQIYRTDLYVDANTQFIKRIIYYYPEANYEDNYDIDHIIIDYKNINLKQRDNSFFSENLFVTTVKGKLTLTDKYKKYNLNIVESERLSLK